MLHTGEGVIVDIGTGDGHFVYRSALRNPKKFYIGIDANPRPLEKISEKIYRKPAKGGLPNALFLQAAVEDLPPDLDGIADEIHIHFPWGSLLRAVATGEQSVLSNLRRICGPEALLEIVIGVDPVRDNSEVQRLALPTLSNEYIDSILVPAYREAGFEIVERASLPASQWACFETSWAKRLKGNAKRQLIGVIARAVTPRAMP